MSITKPPACQAVGSWAVCKNVWRSRPGHGILIYMKLTILSDNNTLIDQYLLGEPGFCCLVEAEGKRFLLDTGYFGIFAQNAEALGISWRDVDGVVLSHCHDDHTRGLCAFFTEGKRPRLVAHPGLFRRVVSRGLSIGCPYSRDTLERYFDLRLSAEPLPLTENLFYLGAIPRLDPLDQDQALRQGDDGADFTPDDTALAYRGKEGVYVITGCSHSGIGNILEQAKRVTNENRIMGVIGGFHLRQMDDRAARAIRYLKGERIPCLYPCHCTSLSVKVALGNEMHIEEVGAGTSLEWV